MPALLTSETRSVISDVPQPDTLGRLGERILGGDANHVPEIAR